MDRAAKLPKIQDEEVESKYGYVYAVSGPGTIYILFPSELNPLKLILITLNLVMSSKIHKAIYEI